MIFRIPRLALLLGTLSTLGGCTSTNITSGEIASPGCHALPEDKIGFQLYSFVRPLSVHGEPHASPIAERLHAAFGAARAAGFRHVERFRGTFGLGNAAYDVALAHAGLRAVASHDGLDDEQWPKAVADAKALGQTFLGSGNFGQPGITTLSDVLATAARLERRGADAAGQGLKFYVHNHAGEFTQRFAYDLDADGISERVSAWEIIAARTNPAHVHFEVDIYWTLKGLGSQTALFEFLRRYRSRILLLHIKDMAADGSITDLGRGIIDWPAVYRAAGSEVAWYLWEYDDAPDPIASARIAYAFMRCAKAR